MTRSVVVVDAVVAVGGADLDNCGCVGTLSHVLDGTPDCVKAGVVRGRVGELAHGGVVARDDELFFVGELEYGGVFLYDLFIFSV
jgi:hypothetical protein